MAVTSYPLVIPPDDVARHLGLPLPLSEDAGYVVAEASQAAQSDLEAYLGRPAVPVTYTQEHCAPARRGWRLTQFPVLSVTSATPETGFDGGPTGLFTVVYVAGIDSVNDPDLEPVRRFIRLHAAFDPSVQILFRQLRADIATRVTSGSVQGQSATVADSYPTPATSGMRNAAAISAQLSMPGSMPTLQTCDRWRVSKRRVYQRPQRLGEAAPWPWDVPAEGAGDEWTGRWVTWW